MADARNIPLRAALLAFTVGLVLAFIVSNELLMARVVQRFLEDPGHRSG